MWKLQMRLPVKLGLGCAMSLGIIATGAAIVKTVHLQSLSARSDYTYYTVDLIMWFVTEFFTIITAACVPTLRPLLPLLHGKPPHRKNGPSRKDAYLSALYHRKKGYRTYKNDNNYHIQMLRPPKSYRGSKPKTVLPGEELNGIMKTTEVDIIIGDDTILDGESSAPGEQGDGTCSGDVCGKDRYRTSKGMNR